MYPVSEIPNLIPKLDDSIDKCQKIVDEVSLTLNRVGIEHEVIEGRFEGWRINNGVGESYHWYIRIREENIHESEGDIVLDPTVSQFTESNYPDSVSSYVPENMVPENMIIGEYDKLYKVYKN